MGWWTFALLKLRELVESLKPAVQEAATKKAADAGRDAASKVTTLEDARDAAEKRQ